jgi:hypothetical protein
MVGRMSADAEGESPRAGLAPWAVGGFVGGAADVTVASVLNGEAAALGCNKVGCAAVHAYAQVVTPVAAVVYWLECCSS